jgi:hypothetical protein
MEGGIPHSTDDIYGLGAILYELLTGKPPFYTGDIMHQVRNVVPRSMRERLEELELKNDIPCGIEQVIMACLSKNVSDRPQSAAEVARLLNGDGEKLKLVDTQRRLDVPQTAKPPSLKQRTWRWAIAGGVVCGIAAWAVAHNARVTAKNQEARQTQTAPSISGERLPVAVPSNTSVTTVAASAVSSPGTRKQTAAIGTVSQPVTNAPITAAPALAVKEPSMAKLVSPTPTTPVSQTPVKIEPIVTEKTEPRSFAQAPTTPAVQRGSTESPRPATLSTPTPDAGIHTEAAVALSKATALQLLQKGNSHVSTRSQNRVLQITSSRAPVDEVPQNWRILYYDDKATYKAVEVRFAAGEMERVYEPNRFFELFTGSSKTLDLAKVKIDSDQAIRIAVAECEVEKVMVKFVELKLERGYGGLPVWNIKLFGIVPGKSSEDGGLGSVIVLAEDGKVLKKDIVTKSEKVVLKK